MILEIAPDSPLYIRIAADVILYTHIGTGMLAIASGGASLALRKGSPLHIQAGNVFFVSMLVMAAIGAAVSPFLKPPQWENVIAGLFTLYLVVSGRATLKQKTPGKPERFAFVFAASLAAMTVALGIRAVQGDDTENASGVTALILFGTLAGLAAVGDLRWILRGALTTTQRLVRHLWRMTFALFIAVGSLYPGQAQLFPTVLRESGVLLVPLASVFVLLIYWLIRARMSGISARYLGRKMSL